MEGVYHPLGVGVSCGVEFETPPLVLHPVVPVLDDVVDGHPPAAELLHHPENLLLSTVTLPALPVSHCPSGQYMRFPGNRAVSSDHLVHISALHEIVVYPAAKLAPEGDGVLFTGRFWSQRPQGAIGNAAVRLPLDAERSPHPFFQSAPEFERIRIPGGAPPLPHNLVLPHPSLHVAGVVEPEVIYSGLRGFDVSFEHHIRTFQGEVLREEDIVRLLVLPSYERFGTDEGLSFRGSPDACKPPFRSVTVIDSEDFVQLAIFTGVPPAAQGVIVPEDAVVTGRYDERNGDLRVILEKLFGAVLPVELIALVLAQTVECFVLRTVPDLADRPTAVHILLRLVAVVSVDGDGGQRAALFGKYRDAGRVGETYRARALRYHGAEGRRLQYHFVFGFRDCPAFLGIVVCGHQALLPGEVILRSGADTDDRFGNGFQTHFRAAFSGFHDDSVIGLGHLSRTVLQYQSGRHYDARRQNSQIWRFHRLGITT